ncbi:tyrosine-protein kinase, non-receptor Jak2 [Tanacetum coccineum]
MSGDGIDHLRIPFEKIEFGRKLEVQGYGTIYEGEFDGRKVALKQLNITNLVNVKPRLLAEILAISRFSEHALLGFCDEKSNEIILVYEYISSGNLADKMRKRPNIIQRLEICLGLVQFEDWIIYIQALMSHQRQRGTGTYAKIACECVIEKPEARPTMAWVVEELEKALMLQGGVVSHVHIPSSINVATAPNETVVEAGPKEG